MSAHAALHRRVIDWYAAHERPLPWREAGTDAWGVLVSEVMSQQTPVARVAPSWRNWLELWPTPADLAAAPTAEVLRAWGTLGYPRRALRLQEAAAAVRDRHDGRVPADLESLRALPGVGEYTAAAVAVFAHGRRHPVLDTNVRRVLARVFTGEAGPKPSLSVAERALATRLLPTDAQRSRLWSVGVMELGALICTARSPVCGDCPLRQDCRWLAAGQPPAEVPARRAQAWHGTDRQCRGRLLRAIRESATPLPAAELEPLWSDAEQVSRCLHSLVRDGLIEPVGDAFALPTT